MIKVQKYVKGVRAGSRDLLLKFWDLLNISVTVQGRDIKFIPNIDHEGH